MLKSYYGRHGHESFTAPFRRAGNATKTRLFAYGPIKRILYGSKGFTPIAGAAGGFGGH